MIEIKIGEGIIESDENVLVMAVGGAGISIVHRLEISDSKVCYVDKQFDEGKRYINSILCDDENTLDLYMYRRRCIVMVAGLGGNTGRMIIPKLVDMANERKIPVIGLFTLPYGFEAGYRKKNANETLEVIKEKLSGFYIMKNELMLKCVSRTMTIPMIMEKSEYVIKMVVSAIAKFCEEYFDASDYYMMKKKNIRIKVYDEIFAETEEREKIMNFVRHNIVEFDSLLGINATSKDNIAQIQQECEKWNKGLRYYVGEDKCEQEILVLVYGSV